MDIQAMWWCVKLTFYDFCRFWSVAVNIMYKQQLFIFIRLYIGWSDVIVLIYGHDTISML